MGFRIQWRRKRGTSRHYVCTFIDDRAVRSLMAKIRALTPGTSQLGLVFVLTRLNQVMHGWANYCRHAVAKATFGPLDYLAWWRVIRMLMERHHWRWRGCPPMARRPRRELAADHGGRDRAAADRGNPGYRCRYRGRQIPGPWAAERS